MNAMPSAGNLLEQPGRRSFVRAVLGGSLAAAAGMPAASASATASGAAEPGLPFHAWAATPPMGGNSWDTFGAGVTEAEYLDNARILDQRFLPFGHDTATIDVQWYEAGATSSWYRDFTPLVLDAHGRPQPASNRFPSAAGGRGFAPLAAQVHAMGNTDMCGVKSEHADRYRAWLAQLAEWGEDFVKVDDIAAPNCHAREVELIRRAIDATGRPMVLSLSPGPSQLDQSAHLQAHANQDEQSLMLTAWTGPSRRLHRPARHLGGLAEHYRRAVGRIPARVAARRPPRLLGARGPARRDPPARHPTPRRTACALCLIRTRQPFEHSCRGRT